MKLLENSSFEAINSQLTVETGDAHIICRIESYSCKMAGDDKHMYKHFCQEGTLPQVGGERSQLQSVLSHMRGVQGPEATAVNAVDEEICLTECDIYSYNPDLDSDSFGEDGSHWSFNYVNKQRTGHGAREEEEKEDSSGGGNEGTSTMEEDSVLVIQCEEEEQRPQLHPASKTAWTFSPERPQGVHSCWPDPDAATVPVLPKATPA
ncbi:hypothetical protein CB1_001521001 [Camelus ferus]|nr:hypothetical protein CB1_001521001 [Camelus ferus]